MWGGRDYTPPLLTRNSLYLGASFSGILHTKRSRLVLISLVHSLQMASHSPIPAYILGAACCSRGIMALFAPRTEYGHVGLPLEAPPGAKDSLSSGHTSPLMYFKGIREVSYGTILLALQSQGQEDALTTVAAVLSLVRFADGSVVWLQGGAGLRHRAWGHWITGIGFAIWTIWRLA